MFLPVTFIENLDAITVDLSCGDDFLSVDFGESQVGYRRHEEYAGETIVTPSEETQVLATDGKLMPANVTINPIPLNYGRIAWDGRTITVY